MSAPLLSPRARQVALLGGFGLLALCALIGFFFPRVFFEGYLTAYIFWVEIALGCLALLLLQYLTGGLWGMTITRLLEAGMMTLPWCGLFFLPLFLGMSYVFPWIHPAGDELRHLVGDKAIYLNVPFYVIRFFVYFLALTALAIWFRGLSLRRDEGDVEAVATMKKWSGPCLIVFVLLMNFACIDWVMSLKAEWYSSMLVVEFVGEQAVVTIAGCILVLRLMSSLEPFRGALTVKIVHDLANLLLAFICFWTYVTFMEYIITWTGNLPHEVSWFSDRSSTGWKIFAAVLVLVHFGMPLFLLIFTSISKNLVRLARVAALVLVAHFLQVIWWVEPAFGAEFHLAWTSLLLIVALGALWCVAFSQNLAAAPLLVRPIEEPRKEAVTA